MTNNQRPMQTAKKPLPILVSGHLSSVISHPSSTIHDPSSVISHQPSAIRHPSSVIRHPSSVIRHPSSVIRHPSSAKPTEGPLPRYASRITLHHGLRTIRITDHPSQPRMTDDG